MLNWYWSCLVQPNLSAEYRSLQAIVMQSLKRASQVKPVVKQQWTPKKGIVVNVAYINTRNQAYGLLKLKLLFDLQQFDQGYKTKPKCVLFYALYIRIRIYTQTASLHVAFYTIDMSVVVG